MLGTWECRQMPVYLISNQRLAVKRSFMRCWGRPRNICKPLYMSYT